MVERYPNLKEEVGGQIHDCEISSLLDVKLARWSIASWALASTRQPSQNMKLKKNPYFIHKLCLVRYLFQSFPRPSQDLEMNTRSNNISSKSWSFCLLEPHALSFWEPRENHKVGGHGVSTFMILCFVLRPHNFRLTHSNLVWWLLKRHNTLYCITESRDQHRVNGLIFMPV